MVAKIENGVYTRRYNHELDREFDSPEMPRRQLSYDELTALRWLQDQKTRRLITKKSLQSQTQWKEKSRKTEIQAGGWGEQR
jgi:hypothetical protein